MLRRFLLPVLACAALDAVSIPALAAWPAKPIRLIVPSAPGGAPDALMRALGQQLSVQLGVPVVISHHKVNGTANHGRSRETLALISDRMREQVIGNPL